MQENRLLGLLRCDCQMPILVIELFKKANTKHLA